MKINASRLFPFALGAVLVLGACGDEDAAGSRPIDTVGQPGLRAPTPIEVTRSAAGNNLSAPNQDAAAASSEMMIAPAYWISEYVVGDGMPSLPTDDLGYVFDANRQVTAEQVARVAAALGVEGEPVHQVEEYGSFWRVGSDDGSAPGLWVSEDSQQSWNYNGAWQGREAAVSCAVAVDSDGNQFGECPEVEPPVGVPTQAEAEQRARQVLAALGEDVSTLQVESYGDGWYANVTFRDGADDFTPLREWSFGFGANGVMEYANGSLAQPEPVGPYPLIDIDTAIARLNDGDYGYGGYGGYGGGIDSGIAIAEGPPVELAIDVAVGAPVETEIAVDIPESEVSSQETQGSSGSTESVIAEVPMPVEETPVGETPVGETPVGDMPVEEMPDEDMPGGDMPVEEMPEPEPVVVTLVDVQADLWWAWDADGSVWLLPAYRFIDSDGGRHTVPAVTDDFMIHVDPPVFVGEPLPAPVPLPAPQPEPVGPAPEPVPVDPAPQPEGPDLAPVEILEIIRDVQYYPGCANEPVTIEGTTWYPLSGGEIDEIEAKILEPRQEPTDGVSGFALRVAPPGPGDDVGSLVVYVDGIARYETDSGFVIWLTLEEQTYGWVC